MSNLAQQAFESMVDLEGVIIGHESGMITDDQLIEWLTNCDEEDFEILQAELDIETVQNLAEACDLEPGELDGLLDEDLEAAHELLKKKLIRGGKVITKTFKRLTAGVRRKLSIAAKKAGRLRKGKRLGAATKAKIKKSLILRGKRKLGPVTVKKKP